MFRALPSTTMMLFFRKLQFICRCCFRIACRSHGLSVTLKPTYSDDRVALFAPSTYGVK